jgi:hypothetical protein
MLHYVFGTGIDLEGITSDVPDTQTTSESIVHP